MSEKTPPESVREKDRRGEWERLTRDLRSRFLFTTKQRDDLVDVCFSQKGNLEKLRTENAKLRDAVAKAIHVQSVLCGDADMPYCREKCPLHRAETNDCEACDVIAVAEELGVQHD